MVDKKPQFDHRAIGRCDALDRWVAADKRIDETLMLTWTGPVHATSQQAELEVAGYHSSSRFFMFIEQRRHRLYLEVMCKDGRNLEWIYQLGSAHPQDEDVYTDGCCGALVYRDQGYEKRLARTCLIQDGKGRRGIDGLSLASISPFYTAAADHLRIKLPEKPILMGKPKLQIGGKRP